MVQLLSRPELFGSRGADMAFGTATAGNRTMGGFGRRLARWLVSSHRKAAPLGPSAVGTCCNEPLGTALNHVLPLPRRAHPGIPVPVNTDVDRSPRKYFHLIVAAIGHTSKRPSALQQLHSHMMRDNQAKGGLRFVDVVQGSAVQSAMGQEGWPPDSVRRRQRQSQSICGMLRSEASIGL